MVEEWDFDVPAEVAEQSLVVDHIDGGPAEYRVLAGTFAYLITHHGGRTEMLWSPERRGHDAFDHLFRREVERVHLTGVDQLRVGDVPWPAVRPVEDLHAARVLLSRRVTRIYRRVVAPR